MDKDNLTIYDLLGKRLLVHPVKHDPYEIEVVEISPSGEYCRISAGDGSSAWCMSDALIISLAEILPLS